jgi:regulator of cell morphogenesis and NO signaling
MTAQTIEATTVRELVGRYRQTRPVFEEYGIDYCCGGGQSLAAAAEAQGVELQSLLTALQHALESPPPADDQANKDWYVESLRSLVEHVVQTHHAYLNQALPRLRKLVATVLQAHRAHHAAMLEEVQRLFSTLEEELSSHLMKEERILFPYIVALEAHVQGGQPRPDACFGSVRSPIAQMEHEHDSAGAVLARLRQVTGQYQLPPDACPTFAALYEELQRLEADLHQHIHLENNILFPRATELEGCTAALRR